MTTSAEVRSHLIDALQLDLVGPIPDDALHAEETLDQAPSKWYLTGFLVPYGVPVVDNSGDEEMDEVGRVGSGEDEKIPEKAFARKAYFPSSMGLSVLLPQNVNQLHVTVRWGDYQPLTKPDGEGKEITFTGDWQRIPREAELTVPLRTSGRPTQLDLGLNLGNITKQLEIPLSGSSFPIYLDVPNSDGLQLVVSVRSVTSEELVPAGTRSVSVFLVNHRRSSPDQKRDASYAFQTNLIIQTTDSFVPRPNLRGRDGDDWDEKVADLQYRDDYEYAVGHNVSAIAVANPNGGSQEVRTAWIPTADVEKVIATQVKNVEVGMEALAAASTAEALRNLLSPMVSAYSEWIDEQRIKCPTGQKRLGVAKDLLDRAVIAKDRITAGLSALDDPQVLDAFRIANRAIALAIRQRATHKKNITPESVAPPTWRPFQLAFLLMNLVGIANPEHSDRELVDLLFFPTGGGKTEAYLGLAAFTLVLRRLHHPGIDSAGLSVLIPDFSQAVKNKFI
ncbi:hypothetical protein [Nostoc sp.]|uniref:hypothetical protein n=1 Tax=Nostoc sp. TaxID=1180 RepID=UPI002FF2F2B2